MKNYIAGVVLWLAAVLPQAVQAQADSTVKFYVAGVCEMCKDRIEEAARGRGVKSATWDMTTHQLTLVYSPSQTTVQKVKYRIVEAGHDLEKEKARQNVYLALPDCCRYRELDKETHDKMKMPEVTAQAGFVRGVVMETSSKGDYVPLRGASVQWLGTRTGTVTDSSGVFTLPVMDSNRLILISYSGYRSDTLAVEDLKEVKVVLASAGQLNEVRVTARQRSSYYSSISPLRTQIMTEKELFKAACCNLSESFETNPNVDVSYNDAVTGSKQIQLLGLSGNYTQLTVEAMPGPRGLATPLGLSFIAGPWVESIQLSKGVGSVVNGFESIAGQINVELKKPETTDALYANAYVNEMGKSDLNLLLARKLGKKWSTALFLHDNFMTNPNADFNNDGFRDLTTGNLFSALNRWKYDGGKGLMAQFGVKALVSNQTGGETRFDPDRDKFTTNAYGLGINLQRYEGFAKIGYVYPGKKYKSAGLQLSAFDHRQDSYFGMTTYDARQQNFNANFIYQSIIYSTTHRFRTGLSLVWDKYREQFNQLNFARREAVPGAFFEYTLSPSDKVTIVSGIRVDHNSLFGWFATPRLHLRYAPLPGMVVRLSAGRGQRTANILAENTGVFVSARNLQLINAAPGKAYGFDPEVAWNKGISVDQKLRLFNREALFSLDFFRNDFRQQVVADLEDPRSLRFYNLDGKSFSNSFQAEFSMEPARRFEVRLAYRFFDVRTTFSGQLLERPLVARHRAFANLAWEIRGWKFDYTVNFIGPKRIPSTATNPAAFRFPERSVSYVVMNAQISKTLGEKRPVDFYLGGENLGNFLQSRAIVGPWQPFGPWFDASLIWGPINGRMLYAGFRYKIQ